MHRELRPTPLKPGVLVLLRDSFGDQNKSREQKLRPRWKGPFRIRETSTSGWYLLEELDGTPLSSRKPGNRLVQFHQRSQMDIDQVLSASGSDPGGTEGPNDGDREPEGTWRLTGEDHLQPQDPAFKRLTRAAEARYGQDAPKDTRQPEVRIPVKRQGFNRDKFEKMDEDESG